MSIQPPPTNTTSPVYNPIFYVNPTSSSGIDVAFLDANYLKFPTAQGSEDFTNGLFSTDTIDFNSATGTNRAITNVSKTEFSDILGNTSYTASIEENSTAIGIYDGGLIINSSNSINLVGTSILANGSPIGTGGGNVITTANNAFTGNNSFSAPATSQTFNNQNIIISSGGTIEIGGFAGSNPTPAYIYFPTTFPTGSTGNNGLAYFWNKSDGGGEVSMICYAQGAGGGTTSAGGLQIYSVNSSPNAPQLLASFLYGSSSISTNPTIPTSTTIGTLGSSQTATTYWVNSNYAPLVSNTFTLTLTPNISGGNTNWSITPTLIQTLNSNSFSFTFYTDTTNTTTTTNLSVLPASGNYIAGIGTTILQNYIVGGTPPPQTTYNGYLFSIINSNGLSMTTNTYIIPNQTTFFVNDGGYFYNNSINLIFNCIKIN